MAGLGMITLGAILNATAFTGGSILGQKFSGQSEEFLRERERHNQAAERFQADVERYNERQQRIYDWKKKSKDKEFSSERDLDITDSDLQAYAVAAPDSNAAVEPIRPVFSNYFQPSSNQKRWELIYIGGGLVFGFLFLK